MDKKEFLEKLAMALAGQVSGRVIEENIAYYDQYISDEVRRGKPVSQVLEELGDPRLIARSIIEANGGGNEMAGVYEDSDSGEETRYEQEEQEPYFQEESHRSFHTFHFNGFWFTLIALLIFFALIWLVGTIIGGIFMLLGPVLLPILVIWMIYWMIKGPRR